MEHVQQIVKISIIEIIWSRDSLVKISIIKIEIDTNVYWMDMHFEGEHWLQIEYNRNAMFHIRKSATTCIL